MERPKAAPTKNVQAIGGSLYGPNLDAGTYEVKVIKDKSEYVSSFTLVYDPRAPYSAEERTLQRETTMKLYALTEQLAYHYAVLERMEKQARHLADSLADKRSAKLKSALLQLAGQAETLRKSFVATEGDGYIDEDEFLREELANVYRQVSTYPGKPTESQIRRTESIAKEIGKLQMSIQGIQQKEAAALNAQLAKINFPTIAWPSFEDFLKEE